MAVSADKAAIDFECVLQPPSSSPSVIGTTRKHFRVASNPSALGGRGDELETDRPRPFYARPLTLPRLTARANIAVQQVLLMRLPTRGPVRATFSRRHTSSRLGCVAKPTRGLAV
jgi:hypothetical protein